MSSRHIEMLILHLFVNPILVSWGPGDQLLLVEPQSNLLFGRFNSIRAVDDVAANLDAEITTNGAGQGVSWVGSAQHLTAGLDHIKTLPHHGNHWTGVHVVDQTGEKGTARQISIVLLQQFLFGLK